jgi:uncharacterized 2Fe-2S/4Fe-4S cluster protein (DUF4445 family)
MSAPQRTQVEGLDIRVAPDPLVRAYSVKMDPPSLADLRADADRLLEALASQHGLSCDRVDLHVMQTLSPRLREWGWECRAVVRDNEVIAVGPDTWRSFGLAVDLGTTKIAGYLLDAETGRTLATRGVMNPQIECGEDVITRITFATGQADGARYLQSLAVDAINGLASGLCEEAGVQPEEIADAVVVGNTAIHHFLLGLPVAQLAASPFSPAVGRAVDVRAREIGLNLAPGARVHLLSNIAGFVGADHVAMLLATGIANESGPALALDIGTNTEVSLAHAGRITSVSCASGPAFEGGHIKDGMRAAPGAIERVRIPSDATTPGSIQYQTVNGQPPVGICGSGILDAIAQLLNAGIVTPEGRMTDHPLVRGQGRQREFVLTDGTESERPSITVTQQDIRELQLAKAAIRSGICALLEAAGCAEEDVSQVVIAGAFGSYIDVSSAIDIGMLPALPLHRFRQVGNAAGTGARLALISGERRAEAAALASRVDYLELAGTPSFMQTFVEASYLGRYRLVDGKRAPTG